jgi:hypothetical protein
MQDLRDPEPSTKVESIKSKRKIRKRKRSSTSVENLSSDTEAIYDRDERKASENAEANDLDYLEKGNDMVPQTSNRLTTKRVKGLS